MNLRLLSFAALAGMLTAAGCGGGTGSGIAPVGNSANTGGSVPSSAARGTLRASFLVPEHNFKLAASSTSRKPAYISPGSSGIEVLLGLSTTAGTTAGVVSNTSWIVGARGAPVALVAKPGTSFSGNTLTAGQAGYSSTSAVSYSYQPSSTAGYYVFTVSITGLAPNQVLPAVPNYYEIGVVLTDITHSNFVLSSGQAAASAAVTSTSGLVSAAVTLNPVLASAYLVGPTFVPAGSGLAPAASYEYTAYAADELGYVIPSQGTTATVAGVSTLTVTDTFLNATWGVSAGLGGTGGIIASSYTAPNTTTPVPFNTTTNPIPTAASLGTGAFALGAANTNLSFGSLPGVTVAIANPAGSLPNQPPTALVGSTITAGQPFSVAPLTGTSLGTGTVSVIGTFPAITTNTLNPNGFVTGYTYTNGTNLPATGTTTLATSTATFSSGIIPIIQ